MKGFHAYPTRISQHLYPAGRQFVFTAFGRAGDGKKEMLRKKFYVVRKKNHVVRKIFYVASIFCGAAGREGGARAGKKRMPWKKVPTAGELSSTAALAADGHAR